jgi:hypothetical protein
MEDKLPRRVEDLVDGFVAEVTPVLEKRPLFVAKITFKIEVPPLEVSKVL